MPSTRCFYKDKNGVRCSLIAREGSNYCAKHKPGSGPRPRKKTAKMAKKK